MNKPDFKALSSSVKASYKTRNWRVGTYSVLAVIIVAAIVVAANLVVGALPTSSTDLDLTAEQIYSLSGESEQILSALDKDVTVYWVVQDGYEDGTLEQILSRYAEYSHVTVSKVDPVSYPNFLSAYTTDSASNNSLVAVCGEQSMYVPYSDIWTYSDYETFYYYYYYYGKENYDVFAGEQKLTSAISYVTSDDLPVMYVLTGHGETGISEDVQSAIALQNVQVEELSLLTLEAVPEDCSLLCIPGPTSDISETELALLRDYVSAGGKMLVTTEYTEEDMTNFKALLSDWSLTVNYGYVLEENSNYHLANYVDILLPEMQSHSITSPLSEAGYSVAIPDTQAFAMGETGEDITVSSLLKSSSQSYLKENLTGMTSIEQTDDDLVGPFVLAAAGTNSTTGAQIVVFGSSVFMESSYSDLVSGANLDLYLNSIDWLCEKTDSISIHTKSVTSDTLSFSESASSVAKVIMMVLVPAAFLTVGIVTVVKRRRR